MNQRYGGGNRAIRITGAIRPIYLGSSVASVGLGIKSFIAPTPASTAHEQKSHLQKMVLQLIYVIVRADAAAAVLVAYDGVCSKGLRRQYGRHWADG